MSASVATYRKVPQTCRTCTRPEGQRMRAAWGCDGPTEKPLWDVYCPRCFGFSHDCERCGGSGQEHVFRCPHATATPDIKRAIECAVRLQVAGIPPVDGGWADQSRSFVEALYIIEETRAQTEKAAQEQGCG